MKVLSLRCSHDHRFEGWFASDDDYASQTERGLLQCPICDDKSIARLPSAPRFSVSKSRPEEEPSSGTAAAVPAEQAVQAEWMQRVRRLMAETDDVGERFAVEARRIHYGDAEERAIRGRATREEAVALRDEGIEVMALPIPAALKEPLQ